MKGVKKLMDNKLKDDIFYFCTLIEYISRKTKNHRKDVINYFEEDDIKRQLRLAEVNHCLTLEQVSDEIIEEYGIANGDYDTVKECKYNVPTETSIGRVYQMLIVSVSSNVEIEKTIKEVFSSFISDEISNFNSNVYYSNPDYLRCSYLDGRIF